MAKKNWYFFLNFYLIGKILSRRMTACHSVYAISGKEEVIEWEIKRGGPPQS